MAEEQEFQFSRAPISFSELSPDITVEELNELIKVQEDYIQKCETDMSEYYRKHAPLGYQAVSEEEWAHRMTLWTRHLSPDPLALGGVPWSFGRTHRTPYE